MFSVSQAARRLGVCPQTIRRWDSSGQIQCVRTPGNHRRVALTEVNRLLGKMHRELIEGPPPTKRVVLKYTRAKNAACPSPPTIPIKNLWTGVMPFNIPSNMK